MKLKGILSDIDGTLYFKGKPIEGAIDTITKLRRKGIKLLFFTNTDSKSPKTIIKNLFNYGFDINETELYTPIIAIKEFLKNQKNKSIFLVTTREVAEEFKEFQISDDMPDYVIIGDFHDNWDVNRLNQAFKFVLNGAELLGTQGNRFYLDHKGNPIIDTGSFIQMISYAASVKPKIFGKPSKDYFMQAIHKLHLKQDDVIVIGDDIESDIHGAFNAGLRGILVKTGKGSLKVARNQKIKPDNIIESFSSIIELIDK